MQQTSYLCIVKIIFKTNKKPAATGNSGKTIMKTYKIVARTNGWIASRDIQFNGRTSFDAVTGLSLEEARKTLEEFLCSDYEYALYYENEYEYIFRLCINEICECNTTGISNEAYFKMTKNRWKKYADEKLDSRKKFDGAGYYQPSDYYGCIFRTGDLHYEYDSRYYNIEEEIEEEIEE